MMQFTSVSCRYQSLHEPVPMQNKLYLDPREKLLIL